ncbi:hypothetical protein [Treponema sp.]|uniref:hypothetical protein n=1 Tax=Treponema sp. TaxID=166 RepID=UPI00298E034F|nr:hypothetical protein [Treponema sp.]MCQ2240859.1 hypothetical protein [Treponema sp.]
MTSRKILLAGAALIMLAFCSCSKDKSEQSVIMSGDIIEIQPVDVKDVENQPVKWSGDEGIVFVIFGYGYNDKEFCSKAESILAQKYGLSENGGLVKCIVFPDDLHNRISNFRSIAEASNTRGIVVLGAPEGCHYTFASIRDGRDNNPDFNIFSFFPQDDILGQEGTCSFVLDHESSGVMEEQDQVVDKDIFEIIVSAVRYAAILPAELPSDNELHAHVQSIVGKRKVHRFVDGETGIQARNHFVIEAAE